MSLTALGVEQVFYYLKVLSPSEPDVQHVWVRGHGNYGPPMPGVVVAWQHVPVRNATAAAWNALVILAPFSGAVLVQWVEGGRLCPVRDASPREPAP